MKTLKDLQNDLLSIRKKLEPLQIAYFEADTEYQEELLESQLQVLEDKRDKTTNDLKEFCYNELKRTGQLSNDIKELFEKSNNNASIENNLVNILLAM
jgi:predicted  nucleic acid-binding Zn-ribbon protein